MFESILVIGIYLTAVFTPLLIPAGVHVVHAARRRPHFRPRLAAHLPRPALKPAVTRRVAAPAAA